MKTLNSKFKRIVVAVIALVGVFASRASGATNTEMSSDRVGSGGRTVELATVGSRAEKVEGVDNFHRVLYMFEHGSKIDIEKAAGIWTGTVFGQTVWENGEVKSEFDQASLSLNSISSDPALDPLLKAALCPPYSCDFLTAPTASEAKFKGPSLFMDSDWIESIEFRYWNGAIVGVRRPEMDNDGVLKCAHLYYMRSNSHLRAVESKACFVFHLNNFKPISLPR